MVEFYNLMILTFEAIGMVSANGEKSKIDWFDPLKCLDILF